MSTISYWETIFYKPYDLIIIGAGITGLSAALFYLRKHPGARVLILEKNMFPSGASSRNAGFTCFGTPGELLDDLKYQSESSVKDRVKRRYEGLRLLMDEVDRKEVEHVLCGGYELFTSHEAFSTVKACIPLFNEWLKEISGEKQVYQTTEKNGFPAISNRLEGCLHSGKLVRFLVNQVTLHGADIRWNTSALNINPFGNEGADGLHAITVQKYHDGTGRDGSSAGLQTVQVRAPRILMATNGYTSRIPLMQSGGEAFPVPDVHPARGYLFVTNELKDNKWVGTFHYDCGYYYWRNVGNRILIGGARNADPAGERTVADAVNPRVKDTLIRFVLDVLQLKNWRIDQEWTGIMGFPENSKTPHLTEVQYGIVLAAGLGGMGVALGMHLGREAARMFEKST